MDSLEIKDLEMVLVLIEEGSFVAAARRLGLTQPAVSGHIANMEQRLGFLLFTRGGEGIEPTTECNRLIPLIEKIGQEHARLRQRASYWQRATNQQVRIMSDGSQMAQRMRAEAVSSAQHPDERWEALEKGADWVEALRDFQADLVITGTYLLNGHAPGIRTHSLRSQKGMTCAWNPQCFDLCEVEFAMPMAVASPLILPSEEMVLGFQGFLRNWCESTYGHGLDDVIEATTETSAVELCREGLGVLILPGNANERLSLKEQGLAMAFPFGSLLPDAFTFGIRCRQSERAPAVLAAVDRLRVLYRTEITRASS